MTRRPALVFGGLTALFLALAAARLCLGSSGAGWSANAGIMADRGGSLLAASLVGGALALSGLMLQALLCNPLADPYVLGLASGAGLGVSLRRWLGITGLFGGASLWAIGGALLASAAVFAFGRRARGGKGALEGAGVDPLAMVLSGVVVGVFCAAASMLVGQLMGPGVRDEISRWMLGAIQPVAFECSWGALGAPLVLALSLASGLAWLLWRGPQVDAATLPEAEARSLGLPLARLRILLFAWSAMLAGAAVVVAGPVAFAGLIAPHAARLLAGPRHRVLAPAAVLCGMSLVVAGDLAGSAFHLVTGGGVLPVGIFTAMLGGPAFLFMLRKR